MQPINLYILHDSLQKSNEKYLNDFCKYIAETHQTSNNGWCLTEDINKANFLILPLTWNYYVDQNQLHLATEASLTAIKNGKELILFSEGDFTAEIPFRNKLLFERCTYASRRNKNGSKVFAMPSFVSNYTKKYCQGNLKIREKGRIPVVGFCGQAAGTWIDFMRREFVNLYRRLSYKLKLRKWEPAPFETTRFRQMILRTIQQNPGIHTNYLLRRRYRAGYLPKVKDDFHSSRLEFVQNILDSDYTVCVRGGGNFSVRFYEALSLGRIPIFVDTDCILPYDKLIDYRQYCVWVEQDEIPHIAEKIIDFHNGLSENRFKELQEACYRLWSERFSRQGFYSHFCEHFCTIPTDFPYES